MSTRSYLDFHVGRKLIRTARAESNRRNARRSTGPKSAAGKAKVAKNALRHGLAIPARLDPALNREIEGFAELIAGASAPAFPLDCARRIAEAQIDLRRIRRVRLSTWSKAETDELKRGDQAAELSQVCPEFDSFDPSAQLNGFAKQLLRLDRYERCALSRRRAAIREFDSLKQHR